MIISHVIRLFMIISHVKIIAFQLSLLCKNYRFSKTVLYIINRKIHGCLEIPDDIMFNTRNKSGNSAHPCIILYISHGGSTVGYYSISRCIAKSWIWVKYCKKSHCHVVQMLFLDWTVWICGIIFSLIAFSGSACN
jgi:hypothetical protein